jgi:hypothetical protein
MGAAPWLNDSRWIQVLAGERRERFVGVGAAEGQDGDADSRRIGVLLGFGPELFAD